MNIYQDGDMSMASEVSSRVTVISSRPSQRGSQILVDVDSIIAGNQENSAIAIDRETIEANADEIKLNPNTGGIGVIIDETPLNPDLYLSEPHSAEYVILFGIPPIREPQVYRSRTLYRIEEIDRAADVICPILAALRAEGDEPNIPSGTCRLKDAVKRARDEWAEAAHAQVERELWEAKRMRDAIRTVPIKWRQKWLNAENSEETNWEEYVKLVE